MATSTSLSGRLEGKVAIITGGASGIGESTARLFVRHGAKIVIADIQDELGHSVCDNICNTNQNAAVSYVHCDVTQDTDVRNAVNFAVKSHGKLDIMFNNAGISGDFFPSILGTDNEAFKKVLEVNLYGAFLGAKYAAEVMIPARKGSILFTASVASVTNGQTPHAYSASKHGVVGLTKNLCAELGQYGIRVNCISPFGVVSPMLTKAFNKGKEEVEELVMASANLKGVMVTAEDVAEAAVYLGSDEAKYVSGMNLVVDGGYSTTTPALKDNIKRLFDN